MAADERREAVRELAEQYSLRAEQYDRFWAPVLLGFTRPLLSALPLSSACRVLEVGCGTGMLVTELRNAAPQAAIAGVDRAQGMLRIARRRSSFAEAAADAERLPVAGCTIDIAVSAFVLFHISEPLAALREMRRVLAPGGCAGLVVWGDDPGTPGQPIWVEELDAAGAPPEPWHPSVIQHGRMNTRGKLAGLMRDAGFVSVHTWTQRFAHPLPLDCLLAIQLGCGMPARRLAGLPPKRRAACETRARFRLAQLRPCELVYRPEVLYAVARSE